MRIRKDVPHDYAGGIASIDLKGYRPVFENSELVY